MAAPKTIGRYTVEKLLGSGSFATVWLAHDPGLDARIAVKVLADNWSLDDDIRRRFLEEARILWRAQHDRIVRVHLVETLEDGRPYFVMDYADGGTLHDRLRDRFARGEQCSVEEAVSMAREIAECLAVAHNLGIVHRDLKPSNILFQSLPGRRRDTEPHTGPTERVVLADFGLARQLETAAPRTVVAGTPAYMAPEQGDPELAARADERSDLFSASAITYEMLAGRPPFPGQSIESVRDARRWAEMRQLSELRPNVPPAIEAVVMRGLSYDPDDRPASVIEWSDALTAALGRTDALTPMTLEPAPESPVARVNQAIGRLTASLRESPVIGALEQARSSLAEPPLITVLGAVEPEAVAIAEALSAHLSTPVAAGAVVLDGDRVDIPQSDADGVIVVLPADLDEARAFVAATRKAVGARDDSPFVALGVVPGPLGVDVAAEHRADPEISAAVLTTLTLAWPLVETAGAEEDTAELLAQAYGAEAIPGRVIGTRALADLLHHLVIDHTEALQAEAAVGLLRRGLVTHATDPAASDLADAVERLELALPELSELQVLRADLAGTLPLSTARRSELRRVLLETAILARLGLDSDTHPAESSYAALEGAQRWREEADRFPYAVRDLAFAVARRYDQLWEAAERGSTEH